MLHTCGNVAGEQRLVTRLLPNIRSESPQRCGFKINFRPESVSGRLVPEVRIAAVLPDLLRLALPDLDDGVDGKPPLLLVFAADHGLQQSLLVAAPGAPLHRWLHSLDGLLVKLPQSLKEEEEVPGRIKPGRKLLESQPIRKVDIENKNDNSVKVVNVLCFPKLSGRSG